MIYQRLFWIGNTNEPIYKEIKIHFKVIDVKYTLLEMIKLIRGFEQKRNFNDIGVYEFVSTILKHREM